MVLRPGLGGGKINNRTHGWKAPGPKRGSDSLLISTHRREPSSRVASFKLCKTVLRPRPAVSHAMPLICQEKRGTSLSSRLDCVSVPRRNKKSAAIGSRRFRNLDCGAVLRAGRSGWTIISTAAASSRCDTTSSNDDTADDQWGASTATCCASCGWCCGSGFSRDNWRCS